MRVADDVSVKFLSYYSDPATSVASELGRAGLGWAYCKIPNPSDLALGGGGDVGVLDGIDCLVIFRTDPTSYDGADQESSGGGRSVMLNKLSIDSKLRWRKSAGILWN